MTIILAPAGPAPAPQARWRPTSRWSASAWCVAAAPAPASSAVKKHVQCADLEHPSKHPIKHKLVGTLRFDEGLRLVFQGRVQHFMTMICVPWLRCAWCTQSACGTQMPDQYPTQALVLHSCLVRATWHLQQGRCDQIRSDAGQNKEL